MSFREYLLSISAIDLYKVNFFEMQEFGKWSCLRLGETGWRCCDEQIFYSRSAYADLELLPVLPRISYVKGFSRCHHLPCSTSDLDAQQVKTLFHPADLEEESYSFHIVDQRNIWVGYHNISKSLHIAITHSETNQTATDVVALA
jgi:hypothetical protein